jgi:hypothetical protein
MRIILLAGPGAVGKTTQLNELIRIGNERGFKIASHFSSTRDTYKRFNISNEPEALKDEEFNKIFQQEVFKDNSKALVEKVYQAAENGVEYFFADRSPLDYIAYYFSVFHNSLTIETINKKRADAYEVMQKLQVFDDNITISVFTFPRGWSKDQESSDGWRADKTGKNFLWSSILFTEVKLACGNGFKIPELDTTSPEELALNNFEYYLKN